MGMGMGMGHGTLGKWNLGLEQLGLATTTTTTTLRGISGKGQSFGGGFCDTLVLDAMSLFACLRWGYYCT